MSSNPGGPDDNPFKGTPFEQIFNALGGSGGLGALGGQGGGRAACPTCPRLMGQMQAMMAPYDGPVNWTLATDIARRTCAQEPDPSPDRNDQTRVADAMRLADHWLDDATVLPSGVTTTAAWSRAEWIEQTTEVWRVLVEPVAEHVVGAMGNAMPEEAKAMAGPLIGMIGKAGGAMFGSQVGAALGGLAGEVLTASDIGLPLGPAGKAALVPHNIAEFAEGLDVSEDDVLLYLSLREAAHQRLFAHVPWLRQHLISAVEDFGRGVTIDISGIEQAMGQLDPTNMEAIQEALQGGLFEPQQTPEQKAALVRLETTLALVEGWVDEVVGQATAERMPAAAKMQEAIRRRRAAGGPAEETFAALVGLELRPRRLRDASTLWGSLRSRQGQEARDAVWAHPDLLPTAADLDDPLGFREDLPEVAELSDEDFDKAIGELLDRESGDDRRRQGDDEHASDPARRRARRTHPLAGTHRRAGAPACLVRRRTCGRTPTGCGDRASPTTSPRARWCSATTAATCCSTCTARRGAGSTSAVTSSDDTTLAGAALREATEESGLERAARRGRAAAPLHPPGGVLRPARDGAAPRRAVPGPGRGRRHAGRSARSRSTCAGGRSTTCPPRSRTCSSWSALAPGQGLGSAGSSHGVRSIAIAWATPSR